MAGARARARRPLTLRDARAGGRLAVIVAAVGLLGVGGCVPARQEVAPTAMPTLVVVTVTPGVPPTPTIEVVSTYVVQPGDTVSGIASRFGVSEESLMRANGLADRNRLEAGQQLAIPARQP